MGEEVGDHRGAGLYPADVSARSEHRNVRAELAGCQAHGWCVAFGGEDD